MNTNKLQFVQTPFCSVEERKKQLREYAKKRRAQNENRDVKEVLLTKNFFRLFEALREEILQNKGAGTRLNAFVYLSYSLEAPTDKLIEGLLARDTLAFCPRLKDGEMQAVEYAEDFSVNRFGIREPIGEATDKLMDIAVIPLLAVDERGNRLGYGGGYYDKYLRKHDKMVRVGFCYDFQIVKHVPTEATDERLDYIVTEKRILSPKRKG